MPNLLKYVNLPVFLISLAIGLFIVYTTLGDSRKIYIYPTPENVDLIQYRDKTGACFGYQQTEIECPSDTSKIAKTQAQS